MPEKPDLRPHNYPCEQMKVHTMFVIGKRDMEADAVGVRVHGKGNLGAKPRAEAIAKILQSVKERCE
jgi:threonyl-tRNA synthetase